MQATGTSRHSMPKHESSKRLSSDHLAVAQSNSQLIEPASLPVMYIPITLDSLHTYALIDSGASVSTIDRSFTNTRNIRHHTTTPMNLTLANGNTVTSTDTTETLEMILDKKHKEEIRFRIVNLSDQTVILGMDWLTRHNPLIDWPSRSMRLGSNHCKTHCLSSSQSLIVVGRQPELPKTDFNVIRYHPQKLQLTTTPTPSNQTLPEKYQEFADVFDAALAARDLPPHRDFDFAIELKDPDTPPKYKSPYRLNPAHEAALKAYIDEELVKGHIRESTSPWGAPIFFQPKPGGGWRPVIDYGAVNAATKKDKYPIPLVSDLLDKLRGSKIFTKIDLRSAYNLVRIRKGDEYLTAFSSKFGHYEYTILPFGLSNAPSAFMRFIHHVLKEHLDHGVQAYFDDILIHTATQHEMNQLVSKVLRKLKENSLFAKLEKCLFDVPLVEYLGYSISADGIRPTESKVTAIRDWPTPKSVKQVQSFLGVANFLRRFVPNFSTIVKPLTDLTKSSITTFEWTTDLATAFANLKELIVQETLLSYPDPQAPFYIETDASLWAAGAVLLQKDNLGQLKPVSFWSRKFSPAEANYATPDRELLAIIDALQEWHYYLLGSPHQITIYTDHANLTKYRYRQKLSSRHARWALILAEYEYTIVHRSGQSNVRADALSRRPDYEPTEQEQLDTKQQILIPPERFELNPILETDPIPPVPRPVQEVITNLERRQQILLERHENPAAGHYGYAKTLHGILKDFTWPKIQKDVRLFTQKCGICQRAKHRKHRPYGLLQPLPIPEKRWTHITMDFIVGLPPVDRYDAIFVVVDRLSKMAHFVPTTSAINAEQTAQILIKEIFRLHGLPVDILSDRGPQFTSAVWKQLLKTLKTSRSLSTAYHPQSDGQTERTNQILDQYLRCFTDYNQENWIELLPMAEFSYNNSLHSATGFTPFFLNYGYHPRADTLAQEQPINTAEITNDTAMNLVTTLDSILRQAKAHLEKAQDTMKMHADQRRDFRTFAVGEYVLLSTRNLTTNRPSAKLEYRHIGPYKIIEQVTDTAYKLELPLTSKAHNVFHVSLLEPYINENPANDTTIPTTASGSPPVVVDDKEFYAIDRILDSREDDDTWRYLIRWEGQPPENDSWEPYEGCEESCFPEILEYHRSHPEKSMPPIVVKALRGKLLADSDTDSDEEDSDDEPYHPTSIPQTRARPLRRGDVTIIPSNRDMNKRYSLRKRVNP